MLGAAQHRAGEAFAQRLPVAEAQHRHHLAGVDGLRGAHRDALAAQRLDELDEVAGQPVRCQRLRWSGAAHGHIGSAP